MPRAPQARRRIDVPHYVIQLNAATMRTHMMRRKGITSAVMRAAYEGTCSAELWTIALRCSMSRPSESLAVARSTTYMTAHACRPLHASHHATPELSTPDLVEDLIHRVPRNAVVQFQLLQVPLHLAQLL